MQPLRELLLHMLQALLLALWAAMGALPLKVLQWVSHLQVVPLWVLLLWVSMVCPRRVLLLWGVLQWDSPQVDHLQVNLLWDLQEDNARWVNALWAGNQ